VGIFEYFQGDVMSLSLKPKHLSRYKDIAWLFYKVSTLLADHDG
jgi:hypothetical protein